MVAPVMVRHLGGRYPVVIRSGARDDLAAMIAEHCPGARVAVITDENVARVLPRLVGDAPLFVFPAGEAHKNRGTWQALTDGLIDAGYGRDSVIVAIGGGVTTDLAGFVAATYLRGIPWIAVPTTTLSMLDAAIGGKTGVDTDAGKNLVGAFHPPVAVLADPDTLLSLPERTYREGLAEAVKHAAALEAEYGRWISDYATLILARDPSIVTQLVRRSVELKRDVVSGDEREGGRRAVLNAGHTIGHALEQASEYELPHGEAVAIGLVAETRLAESLGVCERTTADRVASIFTLLGLPTAAPSGIDIDRVIAAMRTDKKNRAGLVRAVLLASFGDVARNGDDWTTAIDPEAVRGVLR